LKPVRSFPRTAAILAAALMLSAILPAQERPSPAAAAPLNPRFLEYRSNLQQGKIRMWTEAEGLPLGYVPPTVDLSYLSTIPFSFEDLLGSTPLPATYDLRTLGRLTPIRNQLTCGSCWTFATMASIESALMPGEGRTFSENNLKNTAGRDASPCSGGNGMMATAYLARWSGPVNETDDPYVPADVSNSPASYVSGEARAGRHSDSPTEQPDR
jgi:C1A family cysteine protease